MSSTIYGGTTRNGVIIEDMVDDTRDLGFEDDRFKGYFARLSNSLLDEKDRDFKTAAPAVAIFRNHDPFTPIFAVRLSGTRQDYSDEWGTPTALFEKELAKAWDSFAKEYEKMPDKNGASLKDIIKNASEACKRDGYNLIVINEETDDTFAFSREDEGCISAEQESVTVLKHITGDWVQGIYTVSVKEPTDELISKVKGLAKQDELSDTEKSSGEEIE